MKPEKCPNCGAGLDPEEPKTHFACGNAITLRPDVYRPGACYEAQNAALQAQIAKLEAVIDNEGDNLRKTAFLIYRQWKSAGTINLDLSDQLWTALENWSEALAALEAPCLSA